MAYSMHINITYSIDLNSIIPLDLSPFNTNTPKLNKKKMDVFPILILKFNNLRPQPGVLILKQYTS
jgi:hypothetical protein